MYAELKVVERVEEFSCAAAGVVGVGRATTFALQHMLSVHSLRLEHHNGNIYNYSGTFWGRKKNRILTVSLLQLTV